MQLIKKKNFKVQKKTFMKIFAYPNILKCGKLFSLLHILTKSNLAENGKNLMMLNVSFVFS